jgi:UDP-glucose 4-epimerase
MKIQLLVLFLTSSMLSLASPCVLVTGGAGYIGSATVVHLLNQGYSLIVLDKKLPQSSFFKNSQKIIDKNDLHTISLRHNADIAKNVCFIQTDFADRMVLDYVFKNYKIEAVIHFAGLIEVGRSVKEPEIFYLNNVQKTLQLLQSMRVHSVNNFIFPSTAAIYGAAGEKILSEVLPRSPINPYGRSKQMIEMILDDYCQAYAEFKAVSLRFFNAAGALPDYDIGELHEPETHLIPLVLNAAYKGTPFTIFGNDYKTVDGTCIRDYLHIYDLAHAHYLALQYLKKPLEKHSIFNLGTGHGHSVNEVVECVQNVTGLPLTICMGSRREGDPDRLVADAQKAEQILAWQPTKSSLLEIVTSAHQFHQAQRT